MLIPLLDNISQCDGSSKTASAIAHNILIRFALYLIPTIRRYKYDLAVILFPTENNLQLHPAT
jgi:hypothetical protein